MNTQQALEFYADPENYSQTIICGTEMCSPIEIDGGRRARMALGAMPCECEIYEVCPKCDPKRHAEITAERKP